MGRIFPVFVFRTRSLSNCDWGMYASCRRWEHWSTYFVDPKNKKLKWVIFTTQTCWSNSRIYHVWTQYCLLLAHMCWAKEDKVRRRPDGGYSRVAYGKGISSILHSMATVRMQKRDHKQCFPLQKLAVPMFLVKRVAEHIPFGPPR